MAQQPLLALQVNPIDMPTYRGIMEERDAYRVQQNALAQQQLKQQQNAMLNQAYAEAYDPQTGRVDTNKLYGRLAQGGMGAQIPGQMEAYGKGVEAAAKGGSEQYKLGQSFLTSAHDIIYNAATPEDAIAASVQYAQQHPGHPELMQGVTRLASRIKNMTPEEFAAAKPGILSENLTAQQRLEQSFSTQNLGGSTRVLAMSKYGAGGASVVPGSEAQVTMTPTQAYNAQNPAGRVVQDENGNYVLVNPRSAGSTPVTTGGGGIPAGRGGAVDLNAFKAAIVQKESGGDYTALSPKGALGAYQVMPATAKTLAGRLGLPWDANLMRSNTPQGRQYQDAIGNAAIQEAWQAGNGDVGRAAAYYHGGSDQSKWGPKTQAYARDIVTNIGSGGAAPAAGAGQLKGPVKGKGTATASAEAYNAMEATTAKYDGTIERAKRLLNNPALDTIIGNVQGNIPEMALSLYSQDAANALSDYNELLAVAGFQELQAMRDASPTGGALGQVSDSENKLLQQSAFASSRTQDETKFRQSLRNYIKRLEDSKRRVEGAYERTFGGRFAPGAAAPATAGGAPKRLKFNPATGGFD